MDRSNDPRGGKEEGTRELIAPPADAVVSEYHRLEHDSGRERGIVQRVKGEGGWSGDAGGGEFASRWGWRAGDCCVSENGGGVYWEARRFRINLLKMSPTRHTVSPNPQTLKMTVETLDAVSSLALMDLRGGGGWAAITPTRQY